MTTAPAFEPLLEIKFERVVRDCPANDKAGEGDRLIYDYDVLIDGERRAVFVKESHRGRGYRLYDADQRPIHIEENYYNHLGQEVGTKGEFIKTIEAALKAGKIPTVEWMAELLRAEAWARDLDREVELAKRHERLAQSAGPDLLAALIYSLGYVVNHQSITVSGGKHTDHQKRTMAQISAAIAKATPAVMILAAVDGEELFRVVAGKTVNTAGHALHEGTRKECESYIVDFEGKVSLAEVMS